MAVLETGTQADKRPQSCGEGFHTWPVPSSMLASGLLYGRITSFSDGLGIARNLQGSEKSFLDVAGAVCLEVAGII